MQALSTIHLKIVATTVTALMLWLGGFGCTFCCATGVTDACCQGAHGLPGKVSSSQESRDKDSCCKPPVAASETSSGDSVLLPVGIRGCSLLPAQLTSLSPEQRISGDLAISPAIASPAVELVHYAPSKAFIYPPTPRNRGATYLRCCVL